MTAEGQPAGTEVLPHRKTYDDYVRIVEPGRHVFRSWLSPSRCIVASVIFAVAVAGIRLGFLAKRDARDALTVGLACLFWLGGLVLLVGTSWYVRRSTAIEITPRQITVKRRRFVRWRKKVWDLSDFVEATLQAGPVFSVGAGSVQHVPRLVFFENPALAYLDKDSWMSEVFDSKKDAEEFVQDINASVDRARRAPETF